MAWVATGVAAVGVASSIAGGLSANSKAKAAAKQQSKLTFAKRMEEIRQKKNAADYQKGLAIAAVGASNIQDSGSARRQINALDMENMREIAYAQDAARMEKRAIQKGAQGAGNSLFYQAAGDAIGAAAGAYANGVFSSGTPAIDTSTAGGFASAGAAGQLSYTDTPSGLSA